MVSRYVQEILMFGLVHYESPNNTVLLSRISLQEIHNKIMALNYENCKVFIHSVDAQSSANDGILIQVVGEMSNRDEPWKKFLQTFFLAEQPNGYFVLNDIFRYARTNAFLDIAPDPCMLLGS